MKVIIMLNGMLQMLDFMENDAEVFVEVKLEDGTIVQYPLVSVGSGSNINGVVLKTY